MHDHLMTFFVDSVLEKIMSHISAFYLVKTAYFVGSHEKRDRGLLKPSFLLRTVWRFHKTLAKTGKQ